MFEQLLKNDFLNVVNAERRVNAPEWNNEPDVRVEENNSSSFDVTDPNESSQTIFRPLGHGTASYVNGTPKKHYILRFLCYDEYLHQFVFDDGDGHSNVSFFKDHTRMADFIVYEPSDEHMWLVIHELSMGSVDNKRNRGRIQLSSTLNMLCKSPAIKAFIDGFRHKWCILSADDKRVLTPNKIADAFMEPYSVLPEPQEFNFGVIRRFGFQAFETSKVVLE